VRKIFKATGVVAASALLLTAGLSPALAADPEVGSTISGGSLTSVQAGATLSGVTLDGSNTQVATGVSPTAWTITDARGTGAVWALSVSATVPTSAAGTGPDTVARTIPVANLTITPGTVTAGAGADPVGTGGAGITAPALAMLETPQALVSAGATHKGTYSLTPSFSLAIPANAFRSNLSGAVGSALNPYVTTVTFTIG
jgi:hypothetical protein